METFEEFLVKKYDGMSPKNALLCINKEIAAAEEWLSKNEPKLLSAISEGPPKPKRKVSFLSMDWLRGRDHYEDRLDAEYYHTGIPIASSILAEDRGNLEMYKKLREKYIKKTKKKQRYK